MDFRILGPLEVVAADGVVSIGGAKQRALLAILLLNANEVVSNDRLIDALWGERPPETALKALQVHISQLRKALGDALIHTRSPGYVLDLGAHDLDLARFRRLRDEATSAAASDPRLARDLLAEALDLWRGPALANFVYEPFAQADIGQLDEMRIATLEDRVEADLAVGRHSALIGELESAIAAHPHRERLRGQLMLALYRSGRQAEALDAYQHARHALTVELGIEPTRELRELQEAILRQDPALDVQPVPGQEAAPPRRVFVGRAHELAELHGALDDALGGRGRLVLLTGEPGIGKSRLAEELTGRAAARGACVLVGRCWEAGGAPAYWPWVQSLRAYVREAEPAALREQLGTGAADIAQLLPELRALLPDLPEPGALDSEGARFRLFDAVTSFLRSAARARPLVIVFDDLHAADEPSLLMLQFAVREIDESRILILGAHRDVDPILRAPLLPAVAELVREPHARQISLGGLDESQVASYIEMSTGTEPAHGLPHEIHAQTAGNPLFVGEVVHLLAAEGSVAASDPEVRIPVGVRAVIGQRVARLPEGCREILYSAAVLGREFGLDPLARLAGLSHDELLDGLDEALAERVIDEVPGVSGRLRFGHALIRDTLYDELTPTRRMRLHRAAAGALEEAYASNLEPHLAELAHHYLAAADAGVADRAIEYARRAGERAGAQLAYEEAARLYGMALTLIDDDVESCELLLALGEVRARAGDTPASKEAYRVAAELARELGLPDALARAALGYGGRLLWDVSRDDPYLIPLLEAALDAVGEDDSALRVRLLARFAAGPLRDGRAAGRRIALSEQAVEMARRLGDPGALTYALDGYIPANENPDNTADLLVMADEQFRLAVQAGDKERTVEAHEHRIGRLMELGRMSEARLELAAMISLADELRQPAQQWIAGVCAARVALLEGRFAEAERLIDETLRLGERAQSWNATVAYGLQLYVLRREQGRVGEVEELIRRSAEEHPTYPVWRCVLVQVSAALGAEAETRETLAALAADDFAALPFAEMWTVSVSLLAEAASAVGDHASAPVLYELLLPYEDRVAVTYPEISLGPVARYLGLLATVNGHWDEAEAHFVDAVGMSERIGARPWLAHARRDYAQMLLTRDAPGDSDKAEALGSHALATYEALGMPADRIGSRRP
jgi:DNA-binding SARP family transcriptional activator